MPHLTALTSDFIWLQVGKALQASYARLGLARESFFLQSKYTPSQGADAPYDISSDLAAQVRESLIQSLTNLHTEYLDSYIVHDPLSNHDDLMVVWRTLEDAYESGTVKLLGISNVRDLRPRDTKPLLFWGFRRVLPSGGSLMNSSLWCGSCLPLASSTMLTRCINSCRLVRVLPLQVNADQLGRLLADAKIKPTFVQNRLQSTLNNWDSKVRDLCKENGVVYQGFSIIGSNRFLLREKAVVTAAKWYGVTPAQVLIKWALSEGAIALVSPRTYVFKNDNLELGFTLSTPELSIITNYGHPDRGLKYSGTTKITAKMWNDMGEAVNVYWDDPTGSEVLSFTLPPKQTVEAAQVATTYHGHRFVIRNRAGHKLKEWVADAAAGEEQEVAIDLQIKAAVQSMHPDPLSIFWVSPDKSEVSNGALTAPVGDNSLGVQSTDIGTWHGHRFLTRDKNNKKIYDFVMDMAKGGTQVITVPRPRGERY